MFLHVFAFRWQPGVTAAQKEQVATAIRGLQGQIPGLLETTSAPTSRRVAMDTSLAE